MNKIHTPIEKKLKKLILIFSLFLFCGCAINSGVVPIGKDTYMATRQAATGFTGSGNLKAEAFQEANKFCADQGKIMEVVNTHEATPPFILGNFPKAEIQFMCLDKNDPELQRPKMKPFPNVIIEEDINIKSRK